ncbi:methyltransferase [Haloarchaeobius amylolyticus]|uniref:methyltransferase n=1 Tax=Haloarchaeobius amylolyticus TaxID=1198296 RepID=UPI00226F5CBA|nr:methyltransferase [Haloarchaeobius amylolyticus]
MPHVPNLLERLYILRANRAPGAIYDLLGGGTVKSVALAAEFGVFDALAEGPATAGALAGRLDADEDSLAMLCRFLARAGYLTRDGDTYALSDLSDRWMVGDPGLVDWFTFWDSVVYPFWDANAATVLRTGEPDQSVYEWLDDHPDRWPTAQRGFEAVAKLALDPTLDNVDVTGRSHLVDLGGGHGRYSIGACQANPDLEATVVDSPVALDVARENAAAAGLSDRLHTIGGDLLADDIGSGYDLGFAFNVVHGFTPDENRRLFERAADAMDPGGTLVVMDQFEGAGPIATARAMNDFIGFTYRVLLGGRVYRFEQVEAWLRDAGFADVERIDLRRAPGVTLVTGTLPG